MNNELNMEYILRIALKKWYVFMICTTIFTIVALVYTMFFIKPLYASKGLVYINSQNFNNVISGAQNNQTINELLASKTFATTCIEILMSDSYMKDVNERASLDYSAGAIRRMISIYSKNETEVLEVVVVHPDRDIATAILTAFLENANEGIVKITKGGSVSIIDQASRPEFPISPSIPRNTLLGIFIGLLLSAIIVALTELLDTRVKDQLDLTNKYAFPVLGLIPSVKNSRNQYYNQSSYRDDV